MLSALDEERRRKRRKGSGDLRPEEKRREREEESLSDVEGESAVLASTVLLVLLVLPLPRLGGPLFWLARAAMAEDE